MSSKWHLSSHSPVSRSFVSCSIPGTGVLAVLAGPVFGVYTGFLIVHFCSITGASISYFVSLKLGAGLISAKFPDKFAWFQAKIDENRTNLFYYFLFLRLTPVVPNLLLNTAAGLVGVPFAVFFTASLFGQLPFTFMYIKTGMMLDQLTTVGGLDLQSMMWMFVLACGALLPTLLQKKDDTAGQKQNTAKELKKQK